jgi:uncharacterized protein
MLTIATAADLDNGPRAARPGTERMCALSRQVAPIEQLIRFVVGPDGDVTPDLKRKLPGRGLWISASRAAVREATKRGIFGKGFKRKVTVSPTLADLTEQLLVQSIIDALAMAAKARQVVSGFAKVERALIEGQATALIHASDGAADGIRKLTAVARQHRRGAADDFPVIDLLSSDQLDLALGRSNVIHAALTVGPTNGTVLSRCQTLVQYRSSDGEESYATATKLTGRPVPQGTPEHD